MLDTDTKSRIDSARDILVGKVPDPKSQVEQITIALIYKFMDDMDRQSEEVGGKPSFFKGEFKKYRWADLLDKRLGGHERLLLYAEGIERMNENKNIPQLFRDIFKGVFLPYRDPETLNLFLKEINGFTYEHSERLGDAYEYLLSVLGTQGDAGQFRTPRHIIDFIATVVDPQKQDTILDPACGTAGFLISAYKHIRKRNEHLTPDERARLMTNFCGYDIAPDMVRLSRVNLYLHGFPSPVIHEYDTLTSEERWDERYDVIMANPPFMTPKGGIRPHNRFSIKANRSEVLFVDYIAEHLNPSGRAGVIVPNGIVAKTQNAYMKLRRFLVEDSLVAVVSLPAGIFKPYTPTKTEILFFNRALARKNDRILFLKITADGFDLGGKRTPIADNDLPEAERVIKTWLGGKLRENVETKISWKTVEKRKLLENRVCNLQVEAYLDNDVKLQQTVEVVRLAGVVEINPKKSEVRKLTPETLVSFVPMEDMNMDRPSFVPSKQRVLSEVITGYSYFRDGDVLLAKITPCFENGKAGIARNLLNGIGFGSTEFYVLRPSEKVLPEFVYYIVTRPDFREEGAQNMAGTAGQQRVRRDFLEDYEIPLLSLNEQRRIVAEIEGYEKEIAKLETEIKNKRERIQQTIDVTWNSNEI